MNFKIVAETTRAMDSGKGLEASEFIDGNLDRGVASLQLIRETFLFKLNFLLEVKMHKNSENIN